jgi:hypothetical protein
VIARILIWNLYDSKTNVAELREHLPEPPEGSYWISNEQTERFGLVAIGDELPELDDIRQLIGVDAVVFEEFDVE